MVLAFQAGELSLAFGREEGRTMPPCSRENHHSSDPRYEADGMSPRSSTALPKPLPGNQTDHRASEEFGSDGEVTGDAIMSGPSMYCCVTVPFLYASLASG